MECACNFASLSGIAFNRQEKAYVFRMAQLQDRSLRVWEMSA